LDGSDIARSPEIPAWMFDRIAGAADVRFSSDLCVSLESLGALRRELLYRLHPWFGHDVFIHAAMDKADGSTLACLIRQSRP